MYSQFFVNPIRLTKLTFKVLKYRGFPLEGSYKNYNWIVGEYANNNITVVFTINHYLYIKEIKTYDDMVIEEFRGLIENAIDSILREPKT